MMNKIVTVLIIFILYGIPCLAATDKKEADIEKDLKQIAWKAYVAATGHSILAEEGPRISAELILDRDVDGLGKKDDRIHEVRFSILGGPRTRGLILVNQKNKQWLVVFPKKESTEQKNAPDKK